MIFDNNVNDSMATAAAGKRLPVVYFAFLFSAICLRRDKRKII